MSANRNKAIILDWITVSYRSVFLAGIVLVIVIGGGFFYWNSFSRFGPRQGASEAINRAAVSYEEASAHGGEGRLDEMIASARSALGEARASFAERHFVEAEGAALRSESLSRRVIDIAGGARSEGTMVVRFFRLEGDVRVKRAGEFAWESADRKMTLGVGDQIKTSSSASAQIIYFDGTVTTIDPGSLLEIKELYENPVTKVRKVSEKLNWGELVASTQRRNVEGSIHQVETAQISARTGEEGEFRVSYDKNDKTTSVDVFGGRVEVAGPAERKLVSGGERIRGTADGRLTSKDVLPDVPRLISPRDQQIFVYENPKSTTTRLAWERVPGASRYHLLISDRYLFTELLYDAQREETTVVIDGIAAGEYYWKVAAVSSSDAKGLFSETRQFRVNTQRIRNTGDTTPPSLEITDLVQTGPMLIVNGRTEPGAQVWVDNEKVDVSDDGTFYSIIRLRREGWNELTFVAQDTSGNKTEHKERAYVESY